MRRKVFERNLLGNFQRGRGELHIGVHRVELLNIEIAVREHLARRQLCRRRFRGCRGGLGRSGWCARTRTRRKTDERPQVGKIEAAAFQRCRQQRPRLPPLIARVTGDIGISNHAGKARIRIHIAFANQTSCGAVGRRFRQSQWQRRIERPKARPADRHLGIDVTQISNVSDLAFGVDRRPRQAQSKAEGKRLFQIAQRQDVADISGPFEGTAAPLSAKGHALLVGPVDA